jgi:hypothetical protein
MRIGTVVLLATATLVSSSTLVSAFDNGQYQDVPDNVRAWFKSIESPHGVPCCDIGDGHRTTWEKHPGDERYWVPIQGQLEPVPLDAVVHNASNPIGEAVVWYVKHTDGYFIRCFVPGPDA